MSRPWANRAGCVFSTYAPYTGEIWKLWGVCVWFIIDLEDHCQPKPKKKKKKLLEGGEEKGNFLCAVHIGETTFCLFCCRRQSHHPSGVRRSWWNGCFGEALQPMYRSHRLAIFFVLIYFYFAPTKYRISRDGIPTADLLPHHLIHLAPP